MQSLRVTSQHPQMRMSWPMMVNVIKHGITPEPVAPWGTMGTSIACPPLPYGADTHSYGVSAHTFHGWHHAQLQWHDVTHYIVVCERPENDVQVMKNAALVVNNDAQMTKNADPTMKSAAPTMKEEYCSNDEECCSNDE